MTELDLAPLRSVPLREVFLERFMGMLLSGRLRPGDFLPPERELATRLRVSRPVVHDGLMELQARGVVRVHPRLGTEVLDVRRSGSLAFLEALFRFQEGGLDPDWLREAQAVRSLIECQVAREAARLRAGEDLRELRDLLDREDRTGPERREDWVELDFRFHHALAMASGNRLFPMVINSFGPAWRTLAGEFFRDPQVVPGVRRGHRLIVEAVTAGNAEEAARAMADLIDEGTRVILAGGAGDRGTPGPAGPDRTEGGSDG
ncbi:FadR family transcriptional regulator [Myxococcota bacterium]|nr:FadR family transcriptional regulator [Myxococcota bacterium]